MAKNGNAGKIDLFQREINELRPFEGEMLGQIKDYADREFESQKEILRLFQLPFPQGGKLNL